jgi:hypothetical protein
LPKVNLFREYVKDDEVEKDIRRSSIEEYSKEYVAGKYRLI